LKAIRRQATTSKSTIFVVYIYTYPEQAPGAFASRLVIVAIYFDRIVLLIGIYITVGVFYPATLQSVNIAAPFR
jgi:hypothetical protein